MDYMKSKIGFSSGLIVLVLLRQVTSYMCPEECTCREKEESLVASCHSSDLSFKISWSNSNITTLEINCNKSIESLSVSLLGMFQEFYIIGRIIISNCSFHTFAGSNNLKELSILNAFKLSIHPKTFLNVSKLEKLTIVNSGLHGLSPNSLCMLSKIHTLDFSRNQISNMDEVLCSRKESLFNKLTSLELDYNDIQILKSNFRQRLPNLQILSLKGNRIDKIENGALTNFSQLIDLDVSNNNLTQLPDDFLSGCFQFRSLDVSNNFMTKLPPAVGELKKLRVLRADSTLLTDINLLENTYLKLISVRNSRLTTIPQRLCGNDSKLLFLFLEQNSISKIPPNIFNNCTALKFLHLSRNNISILFNESFKGLEQLRFLHLSDNNISSCGKETFLNTQNLKYLYLTSNYLPEIPLIPEGLGFIDLTNNQIRSISNEVFPHNRSFDLVYLQLKNNRIQRIEDNAFQSLHRLRGLYLKENNLTLINKFAFNDLKNLRYLDISYNKITDIHKDLSGLDDLHEINVEHNLISKLQLHAFPTSVYDINLMYNQINKVENGTFGNLIHEYETYSSSSNDTQRIRINLRCNRIVRLIEPSVLFSSYETDILCTFKSSGNLFRAQCKPSLSFNINQIKELYSTHHDLERCRRNEFSSPFRIEANIFFCEYKDTCPENCLCTRTDDYKENRVNCTNGNLTNGTDIPSNATWIDLSANNLGLLSKKAFIRQTKAEFLYLNHSKITGIGKRTFNTFKLLKELHLEYNEIRMLDSESFGGLQNLKVLILKHNKIENISPGTFNRTTSLEILDLSYNKLKRIDSETFSILKMYLSGNPWSCKCEDIKYLHEFLDNRSSEIDHKTIACDQSQIPVHEYDNKFCRNKRPTIYASIGLALILAVFIAVTILYVYRSEIQILLFVRFGWRILSKKNELDEEEKRYDAFVMYHNSQVDFVVNEMLPRLEGTNPAYKLCVHFRDFLAGAAIVDNITEAIGNSKRTILLLNDQFLTSEWCRYEFQAAHFDELSTKLNTLILVLLEDINPDLVEDAGLKLYLKTRTYLRYDDPKFWDRLRFALPEIKQENSVNTENRV